MRSRVVELLTEARIANQQPDAYGLLPDIIEILEKIDSELAKELPDSERLIRLVGGLGRVVTDNYFFSESPLGTKLLELASDIVEQYR